MDLLKDIVSSERKKDDLARKRTQDDAGRQKKYVRRGDLERMRLEEEAREQELARAATPPVAPSSDVEVVATAAAVAPTSPKHHADADEDNEAIFNMPVQDVIRRLRSKGQPIRLFGESDRDRILRLRHLEANQDDTRVRGNEYRDQLARTEQGLQREILEGAASTDERKKRRQDLASILSRPEYDPALITPDLFNSDPDRCYILVYVYIRQLLDAWEAELNDRPDHEKRSTAGKLEHTKYVQTKDNLKPFFRLLKKKKVEDDVMEKIAEILDFVQNREYVKANDSYLRLSIGNSPWPIGVTMVGIHERSAREKIFSNQVAHVLNDETQRKWIQSIKRLMTFAQHKYPPDDMSKCVG
ncbi:hypothetical protein RI367_004185 [Sorochytrium milnesiophthora]